MTSAMSPSLPVCPPAEVAEATCPECESLQAERSQWIERYRDLTARRKLSLLAGRLPIRELTEALAAAESELRQISRLWTEHCSVHSGEMRAASAP